MLEKNIEKQTIRDKIQDIKDFIEEKDILIILDNIGYCDGFRENREGMEFSTSLCHNGCNFNLQYFSSTKLFHCRSECNKSYDIFSIVQNKLNLTIIETIDHISDIIGYSYEDRKKRSEIFDVVKEIRLLKANKQEKIKENIIYPESILDQYYINPVQQWLDEGISEESQRVFEVGLSLVDKRIIVPHRKWDTGELIGVVGRTIRDNYKQLKIAKWLPVYHVYNTLNIFGLWNNYNYVVESGEIIIVESEKTPMLARSMGINNVCAISGHDISQEQIKILAKLGVKVIIGMDKDVSTKMVLKKIKPLSLITNTYLIETQICKQLDEKDSPFDKGFEVFQQLYDKRREV